MKFDTNELDWEQFEEYKTGENEYDFSNAPKEVIQKMYSLLKDDDQIMVHKNNSNNG